MALSATSMVSRIKAAYTARTGLAMDTGPENELLDLCTGIIEEIQADAQVSTVGSNSAGPVDSEGTIE